MITPEEGKLIAQLVNKLESSTGIVNVYVKKASEAIEVNDYDLARESNKTSSLFMGEYNDTVDALVALGIPLTVRYRMSVEV
jgi:hypothetical protein